MGAMGERSAMEMGGISCAARMTASCSASLRDWAL